MPWPLSQDYNEAIQSPQTSFSDAELRGGEVAVNAMGLPQPCSGNFADVYRFNCASMGRTWAVKCFTRQIPGLRERYQQISLFLKTLKLPFMVDFTFLDQGIRIRGDWYPILKMEWAEGQPLNQFVKNHLDKPQMLQRLCQIWVKLASRLRDANFAHCDLQHGNVLLVPGSKTGSLGVKLVDYDGMCVPSLTMLKSLEVGHPAYQHPQRLREGIYNLEVDRFSHLVIYTALRSLLIGGKSLWDRYDNGDNMLFCQDDFKAPGKSPLFKELLQSPDAEVKRLVKVVHDAAQKPMEQAPLLSDLVPDERVSAAAPVAKSSRAQPGVFGVAPVLQSPPSAVNEQGYSKDDATESARPRRQKAKTQKPRQLNFSLVAGLGGLIFFVCTLAVIGVAYFLSKGEPPQVAKTEPATNHGPMDVIEIDDPPVPPSKTPEGTNPAGGAKADPKAPLQIPNLLEIPSTKLSTTPEKKIAPAKSTDVPPAKLPTIPEKKVTPPKPTPDPAPVLENKAPWIDLLRLIDPAKHRVTGEWSFSGSSLLGNAEDTARLQIPYQPPPEYMLRLSVDGSTKGFWIALVVPQSQCAVCFDCYANHEKSGLQLIDGKFLLDNGTMFKGPLFAKSKPSEILCTVRNDSLTVTVDGRRIIDWQGDYGSSGKCALLALKTWTWFPLMELYQHTPQEEYACPPAYFTTVSALLATVMSANPSKKGK